jgi:hypothetical protein
MRIVETDNYGRDCANESFLLWPMPADKAQRIADAINDAAGPHCERYWRVVPDDHKLDPAFEP